MLSQLLQASAKEKRNQHDKHHDRCHEYFPQSDRSFQRPRGFSRKLVRLLPLSISIDGQFHQCYIPYMEWDVEFTDEFERWWNVLSEDEQGSVDQMVRFLQKRGPSLGRYVV